MNTLLAINKNKEGQATLEYVLSLTLLVIILLSIIEVTLILVSYNTVRYAAFMAARSKAVYGTKTLSYLRRGISTNNVVERDSTSPNQTIAEAAAERIIAESLPWESWRVTDNGTIIDGIDDNLSTVAGSSYGRGGIRIKFIPTGVEIEYCFPIIFSVIPHTLTGPLACKDSRHNIKGFLIKAKAELETWQ